MSKALDPKDTCVLVTGGAGFIGSHTVVQLLEGGYQVVIVDDLSNSSAVAVDRVKTIVGDEAAKNLTFYKANVLDRDAMNKIFDTHQIDRVIHFAGFKAVGESVSKPVEYYHNNIENTLVLIDVMRNHGCKSIIFSSSSTVYGDPDNPPVTEEDPKKPATNPYGWTKWMIEQILMDVHTADAAQRQAHGNAGAGVGQVHGADQFLHQHLLARRRHHRQHHGLLRGLQTQIAQHLIAGSPTAQRRKHHRCAEGPVKIHKPAGANHPVGDGDHKIQSFHWVSSYASSMISSTCPTAGTGVRLLSLR